RRPGAAAGRAVGPGSDETRPHQQQSAWSMSPPPLAGLVSAATDRRSDCRGLGSAFSACPGLDVPLPMGSGSGPGGCAAGVEPGAAGIKPGAAGIKSGAPGPLTQAELRRRLVASRHAVSMKMAILDPGRQSCRRGPVGRSALVAGDVALAAARADMTLGAPCPSPPAKQVKPPPKGKRCQVNDETRTAAAGAATRPARTGGGRRTERLGKLLRFLRPYRGQVLLIMGLVLFQTLTELYLPALMASIVDRGVVTGDIGHIWRTGGLMLLVAGVGVGAAIMTSRLSSRTASAYGRDLRGRAFRRVTEFSMREFDELGTATLITRTTNDVTQVQQVLFMTLRMFVSAPLMALGGVFMAISTDPGLSWVIVAVVPV